MGWPIPLDLTVRNMPRYYYLYNLYYLDYFYYFAYVSNVDYLHYLYNFYNFSYLYYVFSLHDMSNDFPDSDLKFLEDFFLLLTYFAGCYIVTLDN